MTLQIIASQLDPRRAKLMLDQPFAVRCAIPDFVQDEMRKRMEAGVPRELRPQAFKGAYGAAVKKPAQPRNTPDRDDATLADRAAAMFRAGDSLTKIRDELRVGNSTVRTLLASRGLSHAERRDEMHRRQSAEDAQRVIDDGLMDLSPRQIGKACHWGVERAARALCEAQRIGEGGA